MIRVFLGCALPVIALGAAAAFLGPDLVTGPRGEPLVLAADNATDIEAARFDGEACATLLLDEGLPADGEVDRFASTRIVAFALRSGEHDIEVAIQDFPGAASTPRQTIVLLFDETGQLVGASSPESGRLAPKESASVGDCLTGAPEHVHPGRV